MSKYTYLFPFELVPKGAKILLYGAGDVGREYYVQAKLTGYCKIIGFLDKNYDKYENMALPIYPPRKIAELDYDFIVVALKSDVYLEEIISDLTSYGVPKNVVVFMGLRGYEPQLLLQNSKNNFTKVEKLAFPKGGISIALKLGPGFGDAIMKKPFLMKLIEAVPNAKVDVYSSLSENLFFSIYRDFKEINYYIRDAGATYLEMCQKYTFAIQAAYLIQIDKVDMDIEDAVAKKLFLECLEGEKKYRLGIAPYELNYVHFKRMELKGYRCHQLFNYISPSLFVDKAQVNIPLDENAKLLCKFKPKTYITINYGSGNSFKGHKEESAKQWPLKYFERFVEEFKKKYKDILIVQVGSYDTEKITGADSYFLGEDIEIVKWVLKQSIFHLDIEGGLVHLATQLGTKCVVLFGSTRKEIFAYPENINISSGTCHGCWYLRGEAFRCAKDLEKPDCMYSITPEMVLREVETHGIIA